jgi:hypothetical protein
MLFALPGFQFPYTVMNRCLYLTLFVMRSLSIKLKALKDKNCSRKNVESGGMAPTLLVIQFLPLNAEGRVLLIEKSMLACKKVVK